MSRSTPELLSEALVHLELASSYAGVDDLDQLVIDAICMRLSAGIEVLARLDPDARSRLFGDNWQFMWGMRNRIAHGYLMVDSDIVWILPPGRATVPGSSERLFRCWVSHRDAAE